MTGLHLDVPIFLRAGKVLFCFSGCLVELQTFRGVPLINRKSA